MVETSGTGLCTCVRQLIDASSRSDASVTHLPCLTSVNDDE